MLLHKSCNKPREPLSLAIIYKYCSCIMMLMNLIYLHYIFAQCMYISACADLFDVANKNKNKNNNNV